MNLSLCLFLHIINPITANYMSHTKHIKATTTKRKKKRKEKKASSCKSS